MIGITRKDDWRELGTVISNDGDLTKNYPTGQMPADR